MSNSMFIPLLRMPSDIDKVADFIEAAFLEFALPPPRIFLENKKSSSKSLTDGFIKIEGDKERNQCWVSISRCSAELTGDEECTVLADVKTRGSWVFAGIVVYAFCRFGGNVIFNDAGELDGQECYTADSLKEAVGEFISQI